MEIGIPLERQTHERICRAKKNSINFVFLSTKRNQTNMTGKKKVDHNDGLDMYKGMNEDIKECEAKLKNI